MHSKMFREHNDITPTNKSNATKKKVEARNERNRRATKENPARPTFEPGYAYF